MNWRFWRALPSLAGKLRFGSLLRRLGAAAGFGSALGRSLGGLLAAYLLACLFLGWWWNEEPDPFDVRANTVSHAQQAQREPVIGYATTAALVRLAETLLDKRGGYLSNDIAPPGLWMDNLPNWEFGVLTQIRDASRAYRIDFARSQSQSTEDRICKAPKACSSSTTPVGSFRTARASTDRASATSTPT